MRDIIHSKVVSSQGFHKNEEENKVITFDPPLNKFIFNLHNQTKTDHDDKGYGVSVVEVSINGSNPIYMSNLVGYEDRLEIDGMNVSEVKIGQIGAVYSYWGMSKG